MEFVFRVPNNISAYSIGKRPFFHCTLTYTNGDHNFNYIEWRAPHYEHEVVRSSIVVEKKNIGKVVLNEYELSVDDILKKARESSANPCKNFKTKEEKEFTFENHVAEYFQNQISKKEKV